MHRPYVNFKSEWLGKRINYDGAYGFQCVDLPKLYLDKCLGFGRIGALGNAKHVHTGPFFASGREIRHGMDDLMQGDIVIRTKGKYGHIAIVDRIVDGKVYVLEQNGSGRNSGNGLGPNAIRVKAYDFSFYDLVLRCKRIFENLQIERRYIEEKLLERQETVKRDPKSAFKQGVLKATLDYQQAIRWIKKKS